MHGAGKDHKAGPTHPRWRHGGAKPRCRKYQDAFNAVAAFRRFAREYSGCLHQTENDERPKHRSGCDILVPAISLS